MKIGFIGTGNMGRILIEAFMESKALSPSSVYIYNRTPEKALAIKHVYEEINVVESEKEISLHCDIIFLCVKPLEMSAILNKIASYLTNDQCIVSITSPISTNQLQDFVPSFVARVIPSITNRSLSGASLYTFPKDLPLHFKEYLLSILSHISKPIELDEKYTRITSDIVSCGPAFISYLLQRMIESATEETALPKETASILTSHMMIGFGSLLEQNLYTLETLQEKVCVRGGITGEGIKVLETEIEHMFNHVFQATQAKFLEDVEKIDQQFKV